MSHIAKSKEKEKRSGVFCFFGIQVSRILCRPLTKLSLCYRKIHVPTTGTLVVQYYAATSVERLLNFHGFLDDFSSRYLAFETDQKIAELKAGDVILLFPR